MPPYTQFYITTFNFTVTTVSWVAIAWFVLGGFWWQHAPGQILWSNLMTALIVLTGAYSATAAFISSLSPKPRAQATWRDAQHRLAWIFCAATIQCVFYVIQNWSDLGYREGACTFVTVAAGTAILGILCAAKTRQYIK
jgi:TRAP-type uncharacterized transport system fused permease subunit